MNVCGKILLLMGLGCVTASCWAAGFLKAQSFPKTFQDLPFQDRLDVLADGYEAWESVFDSNGRCISGCAYHGITLAEVEAQSKQATQDLEQAIIQQSGRQDVLPDDSDNGQRHDDTPQQPSAGVVVKPEQKPVFSAPLGGALVVTSDYGKRFINGEWKFHNGIDLRAEIGKPVYAAADGDVMGVAYDSAGGGGCYVLIKHTINGESIYTSYAHLSGCNDGTKQYVSAVVNRGQSVKQGDLIGYSGDSGNVSAHLHYKIRKADGTSIDPLNKGNQVNFLNREYCFKRGISSERLQGKDDDYLRNNFPGCTGWCN